MRTLPHRARPETPGDPIPDGAGGWSDQWVACDPPVWWCAIENANARNIERGIASTVEATATHVLKGDYHPGITSLCRIWVPDLEDPTVEHRYDVLGVEILHAARRYLVVTAAEYIAESDPRGLAVRAADPAFPETRRP
jgi:head-tail adaptor